MEIIGKYGRICPNSPKWMGRRATKPNAPSGYPWRSYLRHSGGRRQSALCDRGRGQPSFLCLEETWNGIVERMCFSYFAPQVVYDMVVISPATH